VEIDLSLSADEIKKKYNLTSAQAINILIDKITKTGIKKILEKDFEELNKSKYLKIMMNNYIVEKIDNIISSKGLNELNKFMEKHKLSDLECYKILLSNFEFIEISDD